MAWAQQQGVTRFLLSISPQNQPSLRRAIVGFECTHAEWLMLNG